MARSVGYTGLSASTHLNSHNGIQRLARTQLLCNKNDRFWYTVLEPALRGSGGPIKGSAEEAVRRARPAPRPEPPLPLRAASGILLDRLRLSG